MKLYSTRILALAAEIPFSERLDNPDATAMRRSPLCGSKVTVDVSVSDGKISAYGQDVKACALGQAAASITGQSILGRSLTEVKSARDELSAMLKTNAKIPGAPFEGFEVLSPAVDYKNRHASIMLSLEATVDAMEQALSS